MQTPLPETDIAPEDWWLEDYFPCGMGPIFRVYISFREVITTTITSMYFCYISTRAQVAIINYNRLQHVATACRIFCATITNQICRILSQLFSTCVFCLRVFPIINLRNAAATAHKHTTPTRCACNKEANKSKGSVTSFNCHSRPIKQSHEKSIHYQATFVWYYDNMDFFRKM